MGMTLLHAAVRDGDLAAAQALLTQEVADVHAVDEAGKTALHVAVASRQRKAAQWLLQHGADVDASDNRGRTALHYATGARDAGCMTLLLEAGATINSADQDGNRAIHLAAKSHDVEGTTTLLEAGADVNGTTHAEYSPLDLAVFAPLSVSSLATIRVLCSFGAEWTPSSHRKLVALKAEAESRELPVDAEAVRQMKWWTGLRACVLHWEQQRRTQQEELTEITTAVIEHGEAFVKMYLAEVARGLSSADAVYQSKVGVVGPSGWGKSSVVRSIEAMKPFLMNTDDRKIGMDVVSTHFTESQPVARGVDELTPDAPPAAVSVRQHRVTFWDFGSKDMYQVAHAMFYSRGTQYVLVVDLAAYIEQLDRGNLLRPPQAKIEMDRFLNRYIFCWLRAVFSHQADAEFLLLGTKADLLKNEGADCDRVKRDLLNRIVQWKDNYARELNDEQRRMATNVVGTQQADHTGAARAAHIVQLKQTLGRLASIKWLVLSVTRRQSVLEVGKAIQLWTLANQHAVPLDIQHSRVLESIIKRREAAKTSQDHIENCIISALTFCELLVSEIEGLNVEQCRVILRGLHDLGEIVWYENNSFEIWRGRIVLDPLLLLDIAGQVISLDYIERTRLQDDSNVDGVMAHTSLKTLPLWKHMDVDLTEDFKLLLQHFQLAYPVVSAEMLPESDLIIPTYWKADTTADRALRPFIPFTRSELGTAGDHCWEYVVSGTVSERIYDQLVIKSHDSDVERDVRANGFEARSGDFRVRVTLQISETSRDTFRIEATAAVVSDAWKSVRSFLETLEIVLLDYPELVVSRYVVKGGKSHKLQDGVKAREDMIARRKNPEDILLKYPWMPPDLDWYQQGLLAAKTYLKEMKASKKIVSRRQICVVGPSTAGKTSLIKSITRREVKLEQLSKRTIGIDHWVLTFEESDQAQSAVPRSHEVTFSDFAGQDVYQGMHSLFFTQDTLFLICVDLEAYSITLLKAEILTRNEVKMQHLMNEYVDLHILRWIRIIMARQPCAEFVFVLTKDDTISSGPGVDKDEVLAHVSMMLERVMVIVSHMRTAPENEPASDSTRPITHLWDNRLASCTTPPAFTTMTTTSMTRSSVRVTRRAIERLIVESDQSYDMPESYMQVLQAIRKRTPAAKDVPTHVRIQQAFVEVGALVQDLHNEFPRMDGELIKTILRSLRDRGDLLWYEEMDDDKLATTVMLDRLLLIDFLREVFNHKHVTGILDHAKLKRLPLWRDLESHSAVMLMMKKLLQKFQLVYPSAGEMAHDSDLIVPAYWKTNLHSIWVFGGDRLRLDSRGTIDEDVAYRVDWEFSFTHFIPETFFDQLIVASYSPLDPLQIGPDWILYRSAELAACRIVLSRDRETHERSLRLEALLAKNLIGDDEATDLWDVFKRLCKALANVLKQHPGLPHTSFARTNDDRQPNLLSLSQDENVSKMKDTWMPPAQISSECLQLLFRRQ